MNKPQEVMPVRRNRCIRTLPVDNLTVFNHPSPDTPTNSMNEKLYFGEAVREDSPEPERVYILSSDDSLGAFITEFRDFGNSKSSSSSLSWGEECKSEASRLVRDELDRMDRILQGVEPIPPNYDKEEYEEWMEFFPNLCVLGTRITYPAPQEHCDKLVTLNENKTKAVNEKKYMKMARSAPKIAINNIDVDNYLKISPLGGYNKLLRRQCSSRSLVSSEISASKWLKDEEYNSLPFLVGMKSERSGAPKGILKKNLVLPPIEASQFRSVSATPRWESKSLSALSVKDQKYSGVKRKPQE